MPSELLSPGERGEGAFGVTPIPGIGQTGGMVLSYPMPDWTEKFADGVGIVFVDEISSSPPSIQPYLLGLLQERRIGSAGHFRHLAVGA
jgi:hypothetical protein